MYIVYRVLVLLMIASGMLAATLIISNGMEISAAQYNEVNAWSDEINSFKVSGNSEDDFDEVVNTFNAKLDKAIADDKISATEFISLRNTKSSFRKKLAIKKIEERKEHQKKRLKEAGGKDDKNVKQKGGAV